MLKILVFVGAQALANFYAVRRGGAPERIIAGMITLAVIASLALPYDSTAKFDRLFVSLFLIDVCLLLGLAGVALRANRFWPMWAAALQLVTVAVHLVKSYDPSVLPIVYARISGEIGYFIIAVQVLGTARLRERVRRYGEEGDWSPLRL